jgi:hypothetical protein
MSFPCLRGRRQIKDVIKLQFKLRNREFLTHASGLPISDPGTAFYSKVFVSKSQNSGRSKAMKIATEKFLEV